MKVMPIVGVRPQIIKAAPVIHALMEDPEIEVQFIHSGQHYDYEMSKVFFENFNLPEPTQNLEVGSGSHAWQTANMMIKMEEAIDKMKPDIVVVFGDANTTLAGALVTAKKHVKTGHVEAGLRSYDTSMPEEVNRVLVDHCASILFCPTKTATSNLQKENISENVFLVGDTMADVLNQNKEAINKSQILEKLQIDRDDYAVLTMHRQENVDDLNRLREIVNALTSMTEIKIIFPVHPRTEKNLKNTELGDKLAEAFHITMIKPLNYRDMLKLIKESRLVLTDSGGIQKEAFLLSVPCITLRDNTEWVETVQSKANRLVGANRELITSETRKILADKGAKNRVGKIESPFGDGRASERIKDIVKESTSSG